METHAVELVRSGLVGKVHDVNGEAGRQAALRHLFLEKTAVGLRIFIVETLLFVGETLRLKHRVGRLRLGGKSVHFDEIDL